MRISASLIAFTATLVTALSVNPPHKGKFIAANAAAAKKVVPGFVRPSIPTANAGKKATAGKTAQKRVRNPLDISPARALKAIKKGRKMVLFFGTEWCPYTKSLKPKWRKIQAKCRKQASFKKVKFYGVDCSRSQSCQALGVKSAPTVRYYSGPKAFVEYNGPDSYEHLDRWVSKVITTSPVGQAKKINGAKPGNFDGHVEMFCLMTHVFN
jgi:thioredoxin-like negative regulator of GroEL